MKFTISTIINKPINEVATLLNNEELLYKWTDGLESIDLLDGTARKRGAKSILRFTHGNRKTNVIETILENNLPKRLVASYESKGVSYIVFSTLEKAEGNSTKYSSTQEYKFHGFMKFVGFIAPNSFKKQTRKSLDNFKAYAENN